MSRVIRYNGKPLRVNGKCIRKDIGGNYPTDGLVARWEFEDDTTDSYGNWDLSYTTECPDSYVNGRVGKCAYFKGPTYESKYKLQLEGNYDNYFLGTNSFSFSCWLKGDFSNSPSFFAYDTPAYDDTQEYTHTIKLACYPDGFDETKTRFQLFRWSLDIDYYTCNTRTRGSFDLANWTHVVWVYNNSDHIYGTKIYINNNSVLLPKDEEEPGSEGWIDYGGTNLVTPSTGPGIVLSGCNQSNNLPMDNAYMDNAYFYSKALSSYEVSQLYNNGVGI